MKKIFLMMLIFPATCFAQQKKHWIDNYWLSTNLSLLYSVQKRGTAASIDVGRNFSPGFKAGAGYSFLQLDENTNVDVISAYLEKSIDTKTKALFFFAKPGVAIPKKTKTIASKISPYEYDNKKNGLNMQFGTGIMWKVKRHSFLLSAGYNITKYSIITKEYVVPVNPYNPFIDAPIFHNYKLSYTNILVNIGFTL
jgi:hypothetical protein